MVNIVIVTGKFFPDFFPHCFCLFFNKFWKRKERLAYKRTRAEGRKLEQRADRAVGSGLPGILPNRLLPVTGVSRLMPVPVWAKDTVCLKMGRGVPLKGHVSM